MGKIIYLEDYRRKRCLEALMLDIGMPGYCDECGEDIEALLLAGVLDEVEDDVPAVWSSLPLPAPPRRASAARKRRRKQ